MARRVVFVAVMSVALVLALGLRLTSLDLRPMHHDEANQAVKFGALLESGDYRYDRNDHHGPTLYYLTLPSAWARGQATLASLDERTLRVVPALAGAGLILLAAWLVRGLGPTAVGAASLLLALSPALTYYSRFYIQESIFAFLGLAFLIAAGRYAERPRMGAAVTAGVCAGLAYATKETSVIVVPAAMAAVALARAPWWPVQAPRGPGSIRGDRRPGARHLAAALTAAFAIAFLFYTSFLTHPAGFLDSIRAFGVFVDRGIGPGAHTHPWDYYLRLLAWSSSGGLVWTEALVLVLAVIGAVAAFRPASSAYWARVVALYALLTLAVFSALRYKTPWNLVPFYVGVVLTAGVGAAALLRRPSARLVRGAVLAALLVAAAQLGWQSWRASTRYAADPRNPYVYAHTSTDFLRLVQRVSDISAVHPDGAGMLVRVIAGPYEQWPLPWYLRRMTRVGYWPRAAGAGPLAGTPLIVAAQDQADQVGAALGEGYVSEFYGLRPDVILTLYVERGLWDRFLATRQPGR